MELSQNLQTQEQTLSALMAKKARIEILSWTYVHTGKKVADWRKSAGVSSAGLDYRTIVRIENGQPVKADSYHHLRKTFEAAGVVFTKDDVVPQTIDDKSLKINGFTPFTGHIHQAVCARLNQILATTDSKISQAMLMSRIVEQGIQTIAAHEARS